MTELWSIGMVIVACAIGAFGPIYLKKASKDMSFNVLKLIKNKNLIIGVALYGASTIIFIPALKGGELSVLYPFVATTYIWVSLLSTKMLNEKMNIYKWIGIFVIIVGVIFIGLGS